MAASGFVEVKPGISVSSGGLEHAIADAGDGASYLLEEGARDIREVRELGALPSAFFIGDHLGLDSASRAQILAIGAQRISVGPLSVHADDVVAIVSNELDRRAGSALTV